MAEIMINLRLTLSLPFKIFKMPLSILKAKNFLVNLDSF